MTENKYPKPSNGSLICTFADCPDRDEELWHMKLVEKFGHKVRPDACALSLSNSDFSLCGHDPGGWGYCEMATWERYCPRGFVR